MEVGTYVMILNQTSTEAATQPTSASGTDLTSKFTTTPNPKGFLETHPYIIRLGIITEIVFLLTNLIWILGLCGNCLMLVLYKRYKKRKDVTMKLLLNLIITDLSTALILLFYVVSTFFQFQQDTYLGCMLSEQALTYMIFVSQSVLAVATIDRYFAICQSNKYSKIMTMRTVRILISIAWIVPFILAILPFLGFNNWEKQAVCRWQMLFHDWIYYLYSSYVLTLMTFSVVLYVKILKKARKYYSRFCPAPMQGINAANKRINQKRSAIRNGKIMGMVTLGFITCWLPLQISQIAIGFTDKESVELDYVLLFCYFLGLLNCVINPFIYAGQKKEFKEEAKRIFKCKRD